MTDLYPSFASVELERRRRRDDDVQYRNESERDGMSARLFEQQDTNSSAPTARIDEQARDDTQLCIDASRPNGAHNSGGRCRIERNVAGNAVLVLGDPRRDRFRLAQEPF